MLYPSTLVIVSEEHGSLCFKVSSLWSTFPLSLAHHRGYSSTWAPCSPPPGFPCAPHVGKGFPSARLPCQLAGEQAEGCCSYLPMRNTLPSYKSPGGNGAGCQGIWVSGRREAGVSLCGYAGGEPGSLASECPRGGLAAPAPALRDHLKAGSAQAAHLVPVGKGKGSFLAGGQRGEVAAGALRLLLFPFCGARALSNVWARQRKGRRGCAPGGREKSFSSPLVCLCL